METTELVKSFLKEFGLKKGNIKWSNLDKSQKLSDYRKKIVNSLLKEVTREVECEEKCKVISVGSESVTSDLDITITGKKAIDITELFDKKFEELFGGSSQEVFDTNIYATTFIFQPYDLNYKIVKSKDRVLYFIDNQNKDFRDQRLFALVKIIENANSEQMKILEQHIPRDLFRDSMSLLRELKNNKKDYIRELEKIKKLQKKFENAEGDNKLKYGILLKHQISVANFNSDEAYYTQGAFFHVVGKLQSKYKFLPISKNEYIDSVLENTGFLIENYNKYGIYKKKYIERIQDAFSSINLKLKSDYNKITDINMLLRSIISKIPF